METRDKYTFEEFARAIFDEGLWVKGEYADWRRSGYIDSHADIESVYGSYMSSILQYHIGELPPTPQPKEGDWCHFYDCPTSKGNYNKGVIRSYKRWCGHSQEYISNGLCGYKHADPLKIEPRDDYES